MRVTGAGVRYGKIHKRSRGVHEDDERNGGFGVIRDAEGGEVERVGEPPRDVGVHENAPQHHAEDDGNDGEPFNPAVGNHEFFRWEELRENPVFGRRIRRGSDPHDRIG